MIRLLLSCLVLFFSITTSYSQNRLPIAEQHIKANLAKQNLSESDIDQWIVTDNYVSKHNGVNHIYFQQTYQGIPVENAIININILEDNSLLNWNSRFVSDLKRKVSGQVSISSLQAVEKSLFSLGLTQKKSLKKISESTSSQKESVYEAFGNLEEDIVSKLVYLTMPSDKVVLSWVTHLSTLTPEYNLWSIYVDATTGDVLMKQDRVLRCSFGESADNCSASHDHNEDTKTPLVHSEKQESNISTNMYNVYPLAVESPLYGDRAIVSDPANSTASPYGWHDTDGVSGAEYTITRGNNVLAQDDINGNNGSGYSPDGGTDLVFDFTLDFAEIPSNNTPEAQNLNSSLTNLFYWNNIIHDVFYEYGFDEVSGNFQENNYGKGGTGGDYVFADGLDGAGTNNANFGTPADGGNPRMQMFLWNASSGSTTVEVNAPANVAGSYTATPAAFSINDFTITGDVVEVTDGTANATEGCSPLTNGSAITGNIALVDRGTCTFVTKVENAEAAGAIAVIVCNNVAGNNITMSGTTSATIPSVMISQSDCAIIRAELGSLNVTIESTPPNQIDGSFDNGIVAHEYGHGISTRLTGGPSTSCLSNAEQAGEGWSDFFGLVLSHKPGDTKTTSRPIGNYALNQSQAGGGIRTHPYTTDMTVNPFTYDDIKTQSVPHGVGSVFCTILWDLYWDLIEVYGFDTDLYNGTSGNNIAIQLVIDGLKLQPCSPGFIDARDAILAADMINNDGANQCLIWNTFARRGVGFSATQGSSGSRSDGVEAYDLPSGVYIKDDIPSLESLAGETIEFTGTATCKCVEESNVVLTHSIPTGLTLLSVEMGNISGTNVVSDAVTLMPNEEILISYIARVDLCPSEVQGTISKEATIDGVSEDTKQTIVNYGQLSQENVFVDEQASGKTHGGNWSDAFPSLQDAITAASCNTDVTEIWVKAGTYYPSIADQNVSFRLVNGLSIYGGFSGIETLLSERDVLTNASILSGDLGVIDDNSDNSFQVIFNADVNNTAILDGFTIQDGYNELLDGAGILNTNATPIFRNCTIKDNIALQGGGVANLLNSNVLFENCTFINNSSISTIGRTIYNENSNTTLRAVLILDSLIGTPGSTIENNGQDANVNTEGEIEIKKEE